MLHWIRTLCISVRCFRHWWRIAPALFLLTFPFLSSYIIEGSVCYLCICDKSYPRKLAFSYLEELAKEFNMSYGNEADKPGLRPYAFVKFGKWCHVKEKDAAYWHETWKDTFMQKTKRIYQDTRTQHNLTKLNEDLQDVTRIMTKNMEDLLWRGDSLDRTYLLAKYYMQLKRLTTTTITAVDRYESHIRRTERQCKDVQGQSPSPESAGLVSKVRASSDHCNRDPICLAAQILCFLDQLQIKEQHTLLEHCKLVVAEQVI